MAYRLLDPLFRPRSFHLLERERIFRLMEGGLTERDELQFDDEPADPDVLGDEEAAGQDAIAATRLKDPFRLKDPASRPLPTTSRPGNPPARTPPRSRSRISGGDQRGGPLDTIRAKKDDGFFKKAAKFGARTSLEGGLIAKDLVMGGDADSKLGGLLGWDKKTTWIDRAQDVVDIIGVIDPTGVADAANALGYAARGKWGDAAVSALGVIPYAGDAGKIAKWGARASKAGKTAKRGSAFARAAKLVEKGAAKMAEKRAAKAAGKATVRGAEKAAVKGGRFEKLKRGFERGRELYGRGKEAYERHKARRAAREGGVPERSPLVTPTSEPTAAPRPDTTTDLGRRATGPLSGESPPPSLAPPDPGPLAKAREAERPLSGPGAKKPSGAGSRGPRGSTQVPVDADCPEGLPTSSRWGAKEGHKRCNKGTPGTHGD